MGDTKTDEKIYMIDGPDVAEVLSDAKPVSWYPGKYRAILPDA